MSFTNGQYGDDRYLVYQFGENEVIETMSFGQITNNTIEGLLPATFTQMDTTRSIMYKVTSRIPLEDFLQRPINRKDLLRVISGIIRGVRNAQDYMIDTSVILLNKQYIYLKISNFDISLVCLPVENNPYSGLTLREFLWELVAKTAKDKSESREYVSELMEKLGGDDTMSLDELESFVEGFSQKNEPAKAAPVRKEEKPQPEPRKPQPEPRKPEPEIRKPEPEKRGVRTEILGDQFGPSYDPLEKGKHGGLGSLFKWGEKTDKPKKEKAAEAPPKKSHFGFGSVSREKSTGHVTENRQSMGFDIPGMQSVGDFEIPGSGAKPEPREKRPVETPKKEQVSGGSMFRQSHSTPVQKTGGNFYDQIGSSSHNYGGTVIMHEESNETVLEKSSHEVPASVTFRAHLVRESNNEMIPVKGTVFQIGSDYEYSDYHVSNNKTVSATHARIIMRRNEYYIKDNNSRNHTYVNDLMIPSMEDIKLEHGTRIRMGSERFIFKLY